jgi:hypothetical protein
MKYPFSRQKPVEEYQKQIRALLQSENSIINTKELVYNYMKKYNDLVNIRMSRVLNLNNDSLRSDTGQKVTILNLI